MHTPGMALPQQPVQGGLPDIPPCNRRTGCRGERAEERGVESVHVLYTQSSFDAALDLGGCSWRRRGAGRGRGVGDIVTGGRRRNTRDKDRQAARHVFEIEAQTGRGWRLVKRCRVRLPSIVVASFWFLVLLCP